MLYLILFFVILNSVLIITQERRIIRKIMVRGNRRMRKAGNQEIHQKKNPDADQLNLELEDCHGKI